MKDVSLMSRAELEDTDYGKEIQRRLTIEGFPNNIGAENTENLQFRRQYGDRLALGWGTHRGDSWTRTASRKGAVSS